ncbi:MAG: UTP--glucose-1-phosphate uridylyltransferase GalU [Gammaproteobacteria bacterium]|nr:UTP--glucose-1-phosphate uridylyltransferase GalU [Gammaproteobacteria bacterium]
MSSVVKVAVFPVAGRGTRFLPATKASPKEMLPVVDKPLIQYAVEEALDAGASTLVFVTGRSKRAIEDHFDKDHELERELEASGKKELLESIRQLVPGWADCIYIRQSAPLGLGHAVLCARPVVGDRPFFVHLADDLISAEPSCLKQMQTVYRKEGASVLAVQDVPRDQTDKYGIAEVKSFSDQVGELASIVEKPSPAQAPSTLGVVGRYVLTPGIFDQLEKIGRGAGGEIQLTDGISRLLHSQKVFAYQFDGTRYDCGDKLGYLKATVELACAHPQFGADFSEYLQSLKT